MESLKPTLLGQLSQVAESIHAGNFASQLDTLMRAHLRSGFDAAGAHEGTVWLLDEKEEYLVPAFNTGPNADSIVGKFRQPLDSGLISMVLASQQPFLENQAYLNKRQSKLLDLTLETQTYALIEVPFYILRVCRGVISCVQLRPREDDAKPPNGFDDESLRSVLNLSETISRMVDLKLIGNTVGWTSD